MNLTGFQSMMKFWERWHAVNAVQLAELDRNVDIQQLQHAASRALQKLELKSGTGDWRLHYGFSANGFAHVVQMSREVIHSDRGLESFISEQMNRPFADSEIPVRIGVLDRDGLTVLWLCYRHLIADARSIALLMQHLMEELSPDSGTELKLQITPRAATERDSKSARPVIDFRHRLTTAVRSLLALQQCVRRKPRVRGQFEMIFQFHGEKLPVSALRHRAAAHGATIGELITACLMDWLHRIDGSSADRPRSPARAVSVLGDLASRADATARTTFTQNICPFTVIDSASGASFEERVATIQKQLRGEENLTSARNNLNGLLWNSQLLKLLPRPLAIRNQECLFPIGGAISNVNLNTMLLPARTETHVKTYWRSTCATQFCPVIVCLTTHEDWCTITSTHLDSYYSDAEIRNLGQMLLSRLFDIRDRQCPREATVVGTALPALTVTAS